MGDDKRHITDIRNAVSKNDEMSLYSSHNQDFDFIKDKPNVIFLLNKIERLAGVVHLLTNGLSEKEPLRQALRMEVVELFKEALSLSFLKGEDTFLERRITSCISLINVGRISMLISPMNAAILGAEFSKLFEVIHSIHESESRAVSFDIKTLSDNLGQTEFVGDPYKGHETSENVLYNKNKRTEKFNKTQDSPVPSAENNKQRENKDSTREKMILEIIRTKGDVSIKDITLLIKGVSMKTVQRDLVRLVVSGVLNKVGERRWSRYSIKR